MCRLPSRPELWLAVLLFLLLSALACHALMQHNPTVDETGFLLSGLLAWERGDLTFYNVNPPLVKMMQTLPLLTASWELHSQPHSFLVHFDDWVGAWNAFLTANHERFFSYVFAARFVNVLLSLTCGWLIYRWSQDLFGKAASLIALGLWVFSPTVLAWAGVCTVDLGAAFFALAAMTAIRGYLRQPHFLGGSGGTQRFGRLLLPDRLATPFKDNWGSAHLGGARFLFADGSARPIAYSTSPSIITALLTPSGGEVVPDN